MTKQALNSIELYKGNSSSQIQKGLRMQSKSVVKELMDHFGVTTIEALSHKLS